MHDADIARTRDLRRASPAARADWLKAYIAAHLNVAPERVRDDACLVVDLGADSLDGIEIVMEIEDKLGVAFDDDEADKARTVGQLVAMVEAKVQEPGR